MTPPDINPDSLSPPLPDLIGRGAAVQEVYETMLAEYEAPPIDEAADAEMLDYIARRKAEMPDAAY